MSQVAEHVARLRALMDAEQVDAFVIPSADPHQSEYVADHWKCRAWFSGFSGSAGTVAVLRDKAGLWTDGRYFIQAEQELAGSGIDLFRMQMPGVPELIDWLSEQIPAGGTAAVDGRQLTVADAKQWHEKLDKKGISLRLDLDFISELWTDRPALPSAPVRCLPVEYAGRSATEKLTEIRGLMLDKEADCYLLSSLDDIAWLYNIRGGDVLHCPVVLAHTMISADSATLFVEASKLDDEVRESLKAEGITVEPYDEVVTALIETDPGTTMILDDKRVNAFLRQSIPEDCEVLCEQQLTALPKARKNAAELEQWSKVQEFDGVAMVRYWKWLEEHVPTGGVTECTGADRLAAFRLSCPDCVDLSFSSISGYGANAAMMHYFPRPESCAALEPEGFYLIDSGGQYFGGTTDITRTFALGELSDEQKIDYTLVLKGVINLSRARFLKGSAGNNLDILARQPLWEHGLDYKCGTGHGVGHYLNVHEGPQNFSQHKKSDTPFEPGMILTIEPGVYKEGRHGIRTENMVVVEEDQETESGTFYCLRTLTLCPIDTVPLKRELMSSVEIKWLNDYHQMVQERLVPHLEKEEAAWLEAKTRPIG
ncbi:MAG: aminopeptidase P family protein [Pontiellaceae bacterium]|nr:aminopeptidase P family protein [Pontiellaceae bacterium]MBN2783329.1 aminopeptidase P family protein [Pontiellaceae bacterium]